MTPLDCFDLYEDADFYDVEFGDRDREIPFFRRHAANAKGPVLEVACGTGRLTLPLAHHGVDITGLDVSRPMLERARRKAAGEGLRISWLEQDCREIHVPNSFALIFSATNAMQHLHDIDSVLAFLRSAWSALRPDGQLIIDVFNPNIAKLGRDRATRYVHKQFATAEGRAISVEAASHYRADSQILHFDLFYLRNGEVFRSKHVNMRCFFPEELLALCRFSGFEVSQRFGDYDESPFTAASPKQILLCRKSQG